jgi:dipeptidyl aminopeptidase/acylaminoacyl peptidase
MPAGGLLVVTKEDELALLPEVTGGRLVLFTTPHPHIREIQFSPDGQSVAFVSGSLGSVSNEAVYVYPLPKDRSQFIKNEQVQ